MSWFIKPVMQYVAHFGPREWLFSILALLAFGLVCMHGFGSRKNY